MFVCSNTNILYDIYPKFIKNYIDSEELCKCNLCNNYLLISIDKIKELNRCSYCINNKYYNKNKKFYYCNCNYSYYNLYNITCKHCCKCHLCNNNMEYSKLLSNNISNFCNKCSDFIKTSGDVNSI